MCSFLFLSTHLKTRRTLLLGIDEKVEYRFINDTLIRANTRNN